MSKPSIPQGTRDFSAEVVRKRNFILNTIRNVFELYGFEPLETPSMEKLDTLMGKYGDEGDKLIYKIRSNQNLFNSISPEKSEQLKLLLKEEKGIDYNFLAKKSDKALRYDLTIPFARYVAMYHGKLTFPFKRYQMQTVWRGDKPQRGRYREFMQCDADVVGSTSLVNEIEILLLIDKVYSNLSSYFSELDNIITISINNRKIWAGIAQLCGCVDKITDITVALDKFDKIGFDGVKIELIEKGFNEDQTHSIFSCLFPDPSFYIPHDEDYLNELDISKEEKNLIVTLYGYDKGSYAILTCLLWNFKFHEIEIGTVGVKEIMKVIFPFYMDTNNIQLNSSFIKIDSTLARGLNYYTGTIIEVKGPNSVKIGSIGGGGRYDNLTGLFGVPNIPGVGISFGVDRIYDVLEELDLFPENLQVGTKVLFFNLGETESMFAFNVMQQLRDAAVASELYHETSKMDKQFKYADKKNIPFVIIIGSKEMESGEAVVKDLKTSIQETVPINKLPLFFHNK